MFYIPFFWLLDCVLITVPAMTVCDIPLGEIFWEASIAAAAVVIHFSVSKSIRTETQYIPTSFMHMFMKCTGTFFFSNRLLNIIKARIRNMPTPHEQPLISMPSIDSGGCTRVLQKANGALKHGLKRIRREAPAELKQRKGFFSCCCKSFGNRKFLSHKTGVYALQ